MKINWLCMESQADLHNQQAEALQLLLSPIRVSSRTTNSLTLFVLLEQMWMPQEFIPQFIREQLDKPDQTVEQPGLDTIKLVYISIYP